MNLRTTDAEIAQAERLVLLLSPGNFLERLLADYHTLAERYTALADLEAMIALDANMPQFPEPAQKLRAFIDDYIQLKARYANDLR